MSSRAPTGRADEGGGSFAVRRGVDAAVSVIAEASKVSHGNVSGVVGRYRTFAGYGCLILDWQHDRRVEALERRQSGRSATLEMDTRTYLLHLTNHRVADSTDDDRRW